LALKLIEENVILSRGCLPILRRCPLLKAFLKAWKIPWDPLGALATFLGSNGALRWL
jgi:hypothetical protein